MCNVSVLILTSNEGGNVQDLLEGVKSELNKLKVSFELLIVDANSTDSTCEEARRCGARVIQQQGSGYAAALREGMQAVEGKYVLCLDADGSHPPSLIESFWRSRKENAIIIGSRYVPGGSSDAPLFRRFLSSFLNLVFSRIVSLPVRDLSSGYRLYPRRLLQPEIYQSTGFEILIEMAVRAFCDGYGFVEVPLVYKRRRHGISHAKIFPLAKSYFRILIKLWTLRNSVEGADYDSRAFDSFIPLQRYWQHRRFSLIKHFLGGIEERVLDIGCGTSRIIQSLPRAVAMDIQMRKLRFLSSSNLFRVCGSTFELPFADRCFDAVIHSQVIEHVPFDDRIFSELRRVIAPGGTLVIGTPDYGRPWWPIIEFFYKTILPNAYADEHISHYTKASLFAWLEKYQFTPLEHKYICGGELIVKARKN